MERWKRERTCCFLQKRHDKLEFSGDGLQTRSFNFIDEYVIRVLRKAHFELWYNTVAPHILAPILMVLLKLLEICEINMFEGIVVGNVVVQRRRQHVVLVAKDRWEVEFCSKPPLHTIVLFNPGTEIAAETAVTIAFKQYANLVDVNFEGVYCSCYRMWICKKVAMLWWKLWTTKIPWSYNDVFLKIITRAQEIIPIVLKKELLIVVQTIIVNNVTRVRHHRPHNVMQLNLCTKLGRNKSMFENEVTHDRHSMIEQTLRGNGSLGRSTGSAETANVTGQRQQRKPDDVSAQLNNLALQEGPIYRNWRKCKRNFKNEATRDQQGVKTICTYSLASITVGFRPVPENVSRGLMLTSNVRKTVPYEHLPFS